MTPTEAAFDAACETYKLALNARDRSRSAKNCAALLAAGEAHILAADAMRAEQDGAERAATVARRLALVAPRRELRARQYSLAI